MNSEPIVAPTAKPEHKGLTITVRNPYTGQLTTNPAECDIDPAAVAHDTVTSGPRPDPVTSGPRPDPETHGPGPGSLK